MHLWIDIAACFWSFVLGVYFVGAAVSCLLTSARFVDCFWSFGSKFDACWVYLWAQFVYIADTESFGV